MIVLLLLLTPLFFALILTTIRELRYRNYCSLLGSVTTLVIAILLCFQNIQYGNFSLFNHSFYLDALSVYLVTLTAFIGFTTDLFHLKYLENEVSLGYLKKTSLRFYHSLFQAFIFFMLLALTTNNLGILWFGMEGATLATVLLVSIYRTPESLEAAWKYIILCGVGITLALLGTILVYLGAEKVLKPEHALLWTHLLSIRHHLSPELMRIAFVFIIVGYGTKVGLVPMHTWLPDAHGEGPSSVSALLSGLLLNVALYAILRFKIIVDGATASPFTNHLLIGFGLLSLLIASFSLLRQRTVKRLFAYSSIEHMGLMTFAFGLGTPLAVFAGLFHMAMHSLTKTSLFYTAGQITEVSQTKMIANIKGLLVDYPWLGWALILGTLAIIGMPPFGLFISELLILFATVKTSLILVIPVLIGLALGFTAILYKSQGMVFEQPLQKRERRTLSLTPMYLNLALVLIFGLIVPIFLWNWLHPFTLLAVS